MRFFIVLIVIFSVASGFYGCHKTNNNTNLNFTNSNTDSAHIDGLTYSGCDYAGDLVSFEEHIAGTGNISLKDFSWDFGDGSARGYGLPAYHIYAVPGTYVVTFYVNGGKFTKDIVITSYLPGSVHTLDMGGLRRWKGSGSGMVNEMGVFSGASPATIDTQFTIQVMNAGIIRLPFFSTGLTLNIATDDTVNKVLTFYNCGTNTILLRYYYTVDSIVYSDNWSATVGHGYESLTIHSP